MKVGFSVLIHDRLHERCDFLLMVATGQRRDAYGNEIGPFSKDHWLIARRCRGCGLLRSPALLYTTWKAIH